MMPRHSLRAAAPARFAAIAVVLLWAAALPGAQADSPFVPRRDHPPRKVLIGTVVSGTDILKAPLGERLDRMDLLVGEMADVATRDYPSKRLDLVVLPETFFARPGETVAEQAVRLDEVRQRIGACARLHACYLVAPVLMREADPDRLSNTAVLVDREGAIAGIYRKVHPVAYTGSDVLEGGTTPGSEYPVFACDFGRLGIQICFDMLYPDGWAALARAGADIVALPSASAEAVRPASYAREHGYYIVSATPKARAAFLSPLGMIEAQAASESVLVHEIDLSYAVLHWEAQLENGEALRRKYGDRVGFHYYDTEDMGIFWSNDPKTTIGQMIASLGLIEVDESVARIRALQDKARGGPPRAPR